MSTSEPPKRRLVDVRYAVGVPHSNGPIFLRCPFHGDSGRPNLAVYPNGSYCFACGHSETADEFLARIGAEPDGLPARTDSPRVRVNLATHQSEIPPARVAVWHNILFDGPMQPRVDWLLRRGLRLRTLREQQIGHEGDRFTIPVWHADGRLLGVRFRGDPLFCDLDPYSGTEFKYGQPLGQPHLTYRPNPRGRITIITEGELDALLLSQYGYDAIASTGGSASLADDLAYLSFRRPVYIATDQDEPGEQAAMQLAQHWPRTFRLSWTGGKDVTDALLVYPPEQRAFVIERWIGAAR